MNTPLTVLTIQREINPIERNTQINEKKPAPKKKTQSPVAAILDHPPSTSPNSTNLTFELQILDHLCKFQSNEIENQTIATVYSIVLEFLRPLRQT